LKQNNFLLIWRNDLAYYNAGAVAVNSKVVGLAPYCANIFLLLLCLLNADNMRQPDVAFLFYVGSYTQTLNDWVGCTDTPSSAYPTPLFDNFMFVIIVGFSNRCNPIV
jgi:hypothetical protein